MLKVKTIPNRFKKFFWDVKFQDLDIKKHKFFIIERLLEYGDMSSIKWLLENIDKKDIRKVVCTSRRLGKKTIAFWKVYLNIKDSQICTRKRFIQIPNELWPY